jgi:hypothetical protein
MEAVPLMDDQVIEELEQFRVLMHSFDHVTLNTGLSEYVHRVLKSARFRELYFDRLTELIDLGLAGPFLSIARDGHCDYLFTEQVLPNVHDADSFLEYCLYLGNEYRKAVQSEKAHDQIEKADLDILLEQADLIEKLSYLAHTILKGHNARTRE